MWTAGFQVHQRHCAPNEIKEYFHEMILLRFDELEKLECLPARQEANRWTLGQVMEYRQQENSLDKVKILFLSHRWLRPQVGHPDDEDHSKFAAFLEIGRQYCQQKESMRKSDLFFWIDYSCIDQSVPDVKIRSIQSLPFYILIFDGFVAMEHPDYMIRAWCMLEHLFGSSMPVKTKGFDFGYYSERRQSLDLLQPQAPASLEEDDNTRDPRLGGVTDPNDMHYIRALTWFAEKLSRPHNKKQWLSSIRRDESAPVAVD